MGQKTGLVDDRQFRLLVDGIVDYAVYFIDVNGYVRSWNKGAQLLKGYGEKEIVGQHFSRFYTEPDQANQEPQRVLLEAAEKGRFDGQGWRVRKDGSKFWAHVVLDRLQDGRGKVIGFAKITRDITEEKAAKDALEVSERRFRLLVSNVVDYAIYLLDVNGTVSSWNTGAQRLKGYDEEDVLGQHFSMFYPPDDVEAKKPWKAMHTAIKEGRFDGYGWRLKKNGERFWAHVVLDPVYDENEDLIGFAKITQDVTQDKEREDALKESESRFRMLVEQVQGQAMYTLDLNGNITSWNAGAERLKGYTEAEALGKNFSIFYSNKDRTNDKHLRALRTAATHGRFTDTGYRYRKDGSRFVADVVMEALRDKQGRAIGFAKVTRDVTEREELKRERELQQQISEQLVELEQSNRELEQMASVVAHDIKAPLHSVAGLIQLMALEHGPKMPEEAKADLAMVTKSCKHLQEMVEVLLDYSRFQRKEPFYVLVSLQHILSSVQKTLHDDIEATAASIEVEGDIELWGDRHMLELVLQNLVGNAIKYRSPHRPPVIKISCEQTAQATIFAVEDNGQGIANSHKEQVFDMFYRCDKRDNNGHGMGLAACRKLIERLHQGAITLTDAVEGGSVFTVSLPLKPEFLNK